LVSHSTVHCLSPTTSPISVRNRIFTSGLFVTSMSDRGCLLPVHWTTATHSSLEFPKPTSTNYNLSRTLLLVSLQVACLSTPPHNTNSSTAALATNPISHSLQDSHHYLQDTQDWHPAYLSDLLQLNVLSTRSATHCRLQVNHSRTAFGRRAFSSVIPLPPAGTVYHQNSHRILIQGNSTHSNVTSRSISSRNILICTVTLSHRPMSAIRLVRHISL